MSDGKKIDFQFDDDFLDISSSSIQKPQYEDIVSDSSYKRFVDGESYTGGPKHYKKKKHGIKKVINDKYYKIKKWWKCLSKGKRRTIITLTSIILVLAIFISWFFIYFNYNYHYIKDDPNSLGYSGSIDKNVVNIALFGLDSRDTKGKMCFKGNTDSIMILSINTKTKKIKIISIMRDSLVPIDKDTGLTYYKINAAYSWGGPELAIKTLNQNFGLDIANYATVNFYGMSDIIDGVGGIEATLTPNEVNATGDNNHGINDMIQEICTYEKKNPRDYYITTSGKQHLNGLQAVAYARIRYCTSVWGTTNDYGRTDRQRYVMEQLFNKAKTLPKSDYARFAKSLIPCTETSLTYSDIISLAYNVMFSSPTFEQYRIPQNSTEMNFLMPSPSGSFGSVVYYDLKYASKVIKGIIYDDMTLEEYVAAHPIEKDDWYARVKKTGTYTPSNNTATQNNNSDTQTTPPQNSDNTVSDNNSTASSDNTSSTESTLPEDEPKEEPEEPIEPEEQQVEE